MNFRKYEKKSLKFWWHLGNFSPWGGLKFWGDLEIMGGPRKLDENMALEILHIFTQINGLCSHKSYKMSYNELEIGSKTFIYSKTV